MAIPCDRLRPISSRFLTCYKATMALIAGEQFPDNEACLTCVHVLTGSPIYLVARDEDGHW